MYSDKRNVDLINVNTSRFYYLVFLNQMEKEDTNNPLTNPSYVKYLQGLLQQHSIKFKEINEFSETQNTQNNTSEKESIKAQNTISNGPLCKLEENFTQDLTGKLAGRYCRQMLLKEIGFQGQEKIIKTKIAIIGSGGIGCPLAIYLAGAGVGTLGLFDSDRVDLSNLHRQIGHKNCSVGTPKTSSLKKTIKQFNPQINVNQHPFITVETAPQLNEYDLIIDGSDNPECRYIVNDYCMKGGKKLLSGACIGWQGQMTCYGGQSPCYRCIWGDQQTTTGGCSTMGVIGMLPGLVGIILATQAIKMIINGESSLQGHLLTYDSKKATFRKLKLRNKLPNCIGCGHNKLNMSDYPYNKHAVCKMDLSKLPVVPEIGWTDLINEYKQAKILDVRPASQFGIAHLKQMVNLPYEKLSKISTQEEIAQCLKEFPKHDKVFVSCTGGVMSKKGADILSKWGYQAVNVKGGINQYAKLVGSDIPKL